MRKALNCRNLWWRFPLVLALVLLVGRGGGADIRANAADPPAARIELAALKKFFRMMQVQHELKSYAADFNGTVEIQKIPLVMKGSMAFADDGRAKATVRVTGDLTSLFSGKESLEAGADPQVIAAFKNGGIQDTCISDGKVLYEIQKLAKETITRWSAKKGRANIAQVLEKSLPFGAILNGFLVGDGDALEDLDKLDVEDLTEADADKAGAQFGTVRMIGERTMDGVTVSVITIRPDATTTIVIAIGSADNLLRQLVVRDTRSTPSMEMIINFYNIRQNPTLSDADFAYTPPAGAKVEKGDDSDEDA